MAPDDEGTAARVSRRFLAAALNEDLWSPALEDLSHSLGGRPVLLSEMQDMDAASPRISLVGTVNLDPECMRNLFVHFGTPQTNPAMRATIEHMDEAHVPANFPEFILAYEDYASDPQLALACDVLHRPQGIENDSFMYARVRRTERLALKIWRPKRWDFLGAAQLRLLRRVSPVIGYARQVGRELGWGPASVDLAARLSTNARAAFLVGENGRIVFMNAAGLDLVDQVSEFNILRGRLSLADHRADASLSAMIAFAHAAAADPNRLPAGTLSVRAERGPMLIRVVHAGERHATGGVAGSCVIVFVEQMAGPRQSVGRLSPRERECLSAVAEGLTTKQIALDLGLSAETVAEHLDGARRRLGAKTRSEAVASAVRRGLI